MNGPVLMPAHGEVFLDSRDGGRAMRLSWHEDAGVVVLSLWRGDRCAGTFQLPRSDVPAFVNALVRGLEASPTAPATDPARRDAG